MSNYVIVDGELYHHGVKGMRWGVRRKLRGHGGPGKYATKKRRLAGDKRDLESLNEGQRLSVGLTKKRQAAFDTRDKATLEKRISKNERKLNEKALKKRYGELEDQMTYGKKADKKANAKIEREMANIEKQIGAERTSSSKIKTCAKVGATAAAAVIVAMGANTAINLARASRMMS